MSSRNAKPFGVYIHWPYCAQKCPYCDFNSHVRFEGWDEDRLAKAYARELQYVANLTGPRFVESIFFGGGTPSLMQPGTVARIIDTISSVWSLDADAEITLEANPGSVEAARFQGYKSAGVNRVSLGVQSLDDAELKALGRIHSAAEAISAIDIAQRIFDRSSFDLIYARTRQTPDDWRAELDAALKMANGGHLSLYQLTIEPDTPFASLHALGKLIVPDPDQSLALYEITQELTQHAGLPAYEISNHARPGEESRHNLIYWRYGEYAGIGPGAHGRIDANNERVATSTERHPETWVDCVEASNHGFTTHEKLNHDQQADEMLIMGLRLNEGLDLEALQQRTKRSPAPSAIATLQDDGLIEVFENGKRIRASNNGRFILNELVCRLSIALKVDDKG